ncbi:cytochrome P450 71B9-like isoform X4 [Diospyros lotus]|uniref:cytochrome P450 71B9-like isoform X4 n=1 Tax=Diospyros lotus TaxID=55363 RepID=UPI0022521844|nr:cytochrome P450 71B9-like isoform X4 [Diospyros lotus]
MTMFLLLLLAIPIVFFVLQKLKQSGGRFQLPPGPPGLPFVGNLHQLDKSALCRHLWQLSKIYGPLMSLQLGSRPILVVSSAKMAKQFLKTHDAQFAGRPSMVGQLKLSYNGLDLAFAPFDDYWREMRKICNLHLFSAKRVQSFRSIREDEVSKMIKKINKLASDSKPINLRQSIRLERTFKALDGFSQQVIDEHLIDKKSGKIGGEDIIDVLLQLKDDGSSTIKLSMDHIKAVLMSVFFQLPKKWVGADAGNISDNIYDIFAAGTDTNAATLVWIMTELVKNSEAMKKIQDEVRNIDTEKEILYETDLQHLPYLEAIVKETWRLHPPAPLLVPHETIQQCTIGPYTIQPKTIVFVNAWAIGRDPDSWEDPEEFLPSRFINSSIDFKGQNFELIPFGAGRRICPGIHLGVVMVELALANLVRSFNWEIPFGLKKEDIDTEVRPGITMHKKTPLCLLATKY